MHSIGDIVDRLIIENIKLYNIREQINTLSNCAPTDRRIIDLNNTMTILNDNRNKLINLLDEKIDRVSLGVEKNVILERIRTI